jgi:hypothetical protein
LLCFFYIFVLYVSGLFVCFVFIPSWVYLFVLFLFRLGFICLFCFCFVLGLFVCFVCFVLGLFVCFVYVSVYTLSLFTNFNSNNIGISFHRLAKGPVTIISRNATNTYLYYILSILGITRGVGVDRKMGASFCSRSESGGKLL